MAVQLNTAATATLVINDNIQEQFNNDSEAKAAIKKITDEGAKYAQNLAPVGDTGNLRDSIVSLGAVVEEEGLVGVIEVGGTIAPYWAFVEYGTGLAGAGSDQPEPGVADDYSPGPSAGMAAQPFMRPTIWYLKQRIGE